MSIIQIVEYIKPYLMLNEYLKWISANQNMLIEGRRMITKVRVHGQEDIEWIKQCEYLKDLNLYKHVGVNKLVGLSGVFSRVRSLVLYEAGIDVEGCRVLASVQWYGVLESLFLGGNKFGDDGCVYVSDVIRANPKLVRIWLHGCNISCVGCLVIADAVEGLDSLMSLDLTCNPIRNDGVLVEMGKRKRNLKAIMITGKGLSYNALTYAGNRSNQISYLPD